MKFRPNNVINVVKNVEGDEFKESWKGRREVEYVETTITDVAKVLDEKNKAGRKKKKKKM